MVMENDSSACHPASPPAGRGRRNTASGCHRDAVGDPMSRLGLLLRAPTWTYVLAAGLGLTAAVLLALF